MRFKAKLAPEQVTLLGAVVGSIKRLEGDYSHNNKNATSAGLLMGGSILRVDSNKLRLTTKGKGDSSDGVEFFCELATHDGIFLEHRIDSAAQDNAIAMEISLGELRVALRSIVSNIENHGYHHGGGRGGMDDSANLNIRHSTTVIKLAKRDGVPCLCLESHTRDGVVALHHAIPIRVLRVEDAHQSPPVVSVEDFQHGIPIGIDRNLRVILERLQSECQYVCLETSVAGELALRSDSDSACVRTFFGQLKPRNNNERNNTGGDREPCCLKVETKMLVSCLQWQQSAIAPNVANALLCFAEDEMLVVHVSLNPSSLGFFTYSLPIQFMSDDDVA